MVNSGLRVVVAPKWTFVLGPETSLSIPAACVRCGNFELQVGLVTGWTLLRAGIIPCLCRTWKQRFFRHPAPGLVFVLTVLQCGANSFVHGCVLVLASVAGLRTAD